MKASETLQNDESTANETALHRAVDATPAFIHTGRPDGYLDYFNQFYLREGERLAHMGSWSLRPDGIFDYWSPETFVIFGFDPGNGIPNLKQWVGLLHPVDRDAMDALIGKMFPEGLNGDIQYRVDHAQCRHKIMP